MKFIHCADLHLNSKIDRIPIDKSRKLREEVFRSFERLCDFAVENSVAAVIISGDMFDTGRVPQNAIRRVFSAIKQAKSVDFLYLPGNHDRIVLKDYYNDLPRNLKFFSDKWSFFKYENVVIAGIEINSNNASFIYDTLSLNAYDVNIVSLHGQVVGYKSKENAEIISLPRLKDKNIDYLALGHIHTYCSEKLDNRGTFSYSGCLHGRGFDETGRKGFVLIEVDNDKVASNFIDITRYEFVDYEYNLTDKTNWFSIRNEILSDLKSKYSNDTLIKVTLVGERLSDLELDIDGLSSYLSEYFFFAKTKDESVLKISLEDYDADKSILGEFVRTVFAENLTVEERTKILTCGFNALKGGDK